jgi:hypothetical protein
MQTQCRTDLFGFAPVERRAVVAGSDGGRITSDAGALLLGATDRAIQLVERFAGCFTLRLDGADHAGTESLPTRRRSKPDSNCRSHLLEHMELQADAVDGEGGACRVFCYL